MKNALLIFVRHPELGKVKTRLAATLGDETALHIYIKLLEHTKEITKATAADKFVFYTNEIVENDLWTQEHYYKLQQHQSDLGSRMLAAFTCVFNKGYDKVCIIGSDCFELTSSIIQHAFYLLETTDIVVGPAKDGGYYLMAMNQVHEPIFNDKNWSTSTVFSDTIATIQKLQLQYALLPVLSDVDEAQDVPQSLLPSKL